MFGSRKAIREEYLNIAEIVDEADRRGYIQIDDTVYYGADYEAIREQFTDRTRELIQEYERLGVSAIV